MHATTYGLGIFLQVTVEAPRLILRSVHRPTPAGQRSVGEDVISVGGEVKSVGGEVISWGMISAGVISVNE